MIDSSETTGIPIVGDPPAVQMHLLSQLTAHAALCQELSMPKDVWMSHVSAAWDSAMSIRARLASKEPVSG